MDTVEDVMKQKRALRLIKAIRADNEPAHVFRGVFIGSARSACNADSLAHHRIRTIISLVKPLHNNVRSSLPNNFNSVNGKEQKSGDGLEANVNTAFEAGFDFNMVKTIVLPIEDLDSQELSPILETVFDVIRHGTGNGSVLVHCLMGRSRSAAVICAWLICVHGWTVDCAIEHLSKCRPTVRIRAGFIRQLHLLQKQQTFASEIESKEE